MKSKKLRLIIPLAILAAAGIAFAANQALGTTSAIGWQDISLLCPLGALGSILATKTMVPRALISLVIAVILIVLFGRAFCAWICPVPPISKLRTVLKRQETADGKKRPPVKPDVTSELSDEEKKLLGGCASKRATIDSRHWVLGGALLSTAIFGFPVFCLVCPIGLSFATIFLIIRLFGMGDVTWTIVVVPLLLLVEVVFFRKWCSTFCPLGALMSLIAKANRTFRPTIDDAVCIETASDKTCERCAKACPEGINPRNPELGEAWNECTKCRACVEACPSGALKMPLLAKPAETPIKAPSTE